MLTRWRCGHTIGGLTAAAAPVRRPRHAVTPGDRRIRLHAHRSGRIGAGDGQQLRGPRDAHRRRQRGAGLRRRRARAEVARQQRHRVADRHHLAQQRLPQRRRRHRLGGQRGAAQRHRASRRTRSPARPAPWCPRAGRRWTASRRRAGRAGRDVGPGHPCHGGGGARPGERHRIPLTNTEGGDGLRMQPHHAATGIERRRCSAVPSASGKPVARLSAPRLAQAESRHRPAVGLPARGSPVARARRCLGFVVPRLRVRGDPALGCAPRTGCG